MEGAGDIRRESLADQIVERIRAEILAGRYPPGTALPPERELARAYGVNRNSVRQALVTLEQARLISIRQGIGSIVNDYRASGGLDLVEHLILREGQLDGQLVAEVLEARRLAAGGIASLAATRRTDEDLRALAATIADLKSAAGGAGPVERVQLLESAFFQGLAQASRNRVFLFMANSLVSSYRRSMALFAHAFREATWTVRPLEAIVEAVKRRDAKQAARRTEAYFLENERRLLGIETDGN